MKIAACYIRVSTDDQAEHSPESQLKEIQKYAETHGYYIPDEYIFADEGISGRNASKRPDFQRLILTAKKKPKPFEAVLLWKFSRFARNRTDAIVYKNLLRNECGIDVISISESLGEDKGTALILESMFEAMDEYYSINLSAEVKRSMQMMAEKGAALGVAPFGYKNENKEYVIDENTESVVRYIFDSFEKGVGTLPISRAISAMGVRTKRGNLPDNRFVEYVLRNPFYAGYIRWSDGRGSNKTRYRSAEDTKVYKGQHKPIISQEQFDRVQSIINERSKLYKKYQRQEAPKPFMLKGLVRCDICNATLVRSSTKEPSLQCHNYSRGSCKVSHNISLKKANKAVIDALGSFAKNLNFEVQPIEQKATSEVQVTEKMIDNEKRKLQKVKEAYEQGVDTLEEYKENKARIQSNIKTLEASMQKKEPKTDKKKYAKKIVNVLDIITSPDTSEEMKNRALRSIISKIIFVKSSNEFQIYFYE